MYKTVKPIKTVPRPANSGHQGKPVHHKPSHFINKPTNKTPFDSMNTAKAPGKLNNHC